MNSKCTSVHLIALYTGPSSSGSVSGISDGPVVLTPHVTIHVTGVVVVPGSTTSSVCSGYEVDETADPSGSN